MGIEMTVQSAGAEGEASRSTSVILKCSLRMVVPSSGTRRNRPPGAGNEIGVEEGISLGLAAVAGVEFLGEEGRSEGRSRGLDSFSSSSSRCQR